MEKECFHEKFMWGTTEGRIVGGNCPKCGISIDLPELVKALMTRVLSLEEAVRRLKHNGKFA